MRFSVFFEINTGGNFNEVDRRQGNQDFFNFRALSLNP